MWVAVSVPILLQLSMCVRDQSLRLMHPSQQTPNVKPWIRRTDNPSFRHPVAVKNWHSSSGSTTNRSAPIRKANVAPGAKVTSPTCSAPGHGHVFKNVRVALEILSLFSDNPHVERWKTWAVPNQSRFVDSELVVTIWLFKPWKITIFNR